MLTPRFFFPTHKDSLQQVVRVLVIRGPQPDQVPGELPADQQLAVGAPGEEGRLEVDGQGALRQRQQLHPLPDLLGALLHDGLHQEAGALRIRQHTYGFLCDVILCTMYNYLLQLTLCPSAYFSFSSTRKKTLVLVQLCNASAPLTIVYSRIPNHHWISESEAYVNLNSVIVLSESLLSIRRISESFFPPILLGHLRKHL